MFTTTPSAGARIAARPELSGVRLLEFDATAGWRHGWFTLAALSELAAPLAPGASSPLSASPFTPWAAPTHERGRASRQRRRAATFRERQYE